MRPHRACVGRHQGKSPSVAWRPSRTLFMFYVCFSLHLQPSPRPTKVLCIEVTDDRDPFFLHSLTVGEAEFALLKEEQSILVDFNAFHAKFIELLNECLQSKATAQPRFVDLRIPQRNQYNCRTAMDGSPLSAPCLATPPPMQVLLCASCQRSQPRIVLCAVCGRDEPVQAADPYPAGLAQWQ